MNTNRSGMGGHAVIEIKSPRKCFPLSLIVVDAKADLQTKASNGHGQGLSQKLIGFEPVSPLRASSANKHGEKKIDTQKARNDRNKKPKKTHWIRHGHQLCPCLGTVGAQDV